MINKNFEWKDINVDDIVTLHTDEQFRISFKTPTKNPFRNVNGFFHFLGIPLSSSYKGYYSQNDEQNIYLKDIKKIERHTQ